jgi:hypothetical protein
MGQTSTGAKPQKRDADTKLAQSRLNVLELARNSAMELWLKLGDGPEGRHIMALFTRLNSLSRKG